MIKDLGSANGTFVNGNRITECYLNVGDIVKCGALFLDWTQYINTGTVSSAPTNFQRPENNSIVLNESDSILSTTKYNAVDVFRYLTTRIFEIGDLFKTNWDKVSSILLLKGIPVVLAFFISVIAYSKYNNAEFFCLPIISALFVYAVSPFITIYLLSLNKNVQIDKVALASGIMGFIQFSIALCFTFYVFMYYQSIRSDYVNVFTNKLGFSFFILVTALLFIILIVNLFIALYLFMYKYFVSVGVSRSKSIYLIIITITLDILLKILFVYLIYLIAAKNINNFNI
jgi:hypothetical protein